MMMRLTLSLFATSSCLLSFSQSSIVFNNDAFMVIDNNAFVVINNSNVAGITQLGTGGRIVSESENDRVKWMVGTATGTYVVPFATAAGVEIPLTLNITGAGTGAGNVTFSTYAGGNWNNNTYRPSDVTHTLDYATGSVNNSPHVIDRFWIVDPLAYTAKPSATMALTYIDAEHAAAGNTIVESNLAAQRFNSTSGIWADYLPQGTINTATNVVSAIPVTAANFFRSWTLSEITFPLPIELLDFQCGCDETNVNVQWTVGSEYNIAQYHVLGSYNGSDYENIQSIQPRGGSGNLSYTVAAGNQYNYYALETEEISGERKREAVQPVNCGSTSSGAGAWVQNENIVLNFNLGVSAPVQVELYETSGHLVHTASFSAAEGNSRFQWENLKLAKGVYLVRMVSAENQLMKTVRIFK